MIWTGADTIETLSFICQNVAKALKTGSFVLRKWISNHQGIFNQTKNITSEHTTHNLTERQSTKTLGLV